MAVATTAAAAAAEPGLLWCVVEVLVGVEAPRARARVFDEREREDRGL